MIGMHKLLDAAATTPHSRHGSGEAGLTMPYCSSFEELQRAKQNLVRLNASPGGGWGRIWVQIPYLQATLHATLCIALGCAVRKALEARLAGEGVGAAARREATCAAIGRALAASQAGEGVALSPCILHSTGLLASPTVQPVAWT